jgi:spermidine synthase
MDEHQPAAPQKIRPFILELTVFVCGALVMIYEIVGSRVLSPFIGASTYVWTSLIGVILGALSLGYWIGGKWADRKPDVKVLASAIFLAGGLVSLTILFKDIILSFVASIPVGLEIKSVLAALLLFAPASVCLGFVTPYSVKLKMLSLADSGKTVGRLYALSTVGSILGTFAAGFFLIPFAGSTRTLYLVGAILIGLSILLIPFSMTRFNLMVLILFILGIGASELGTYTLRAANGLHDIDTEYSRVQVFQTTDPKTGKKIQALATDPSFIQSAMFLDDDEVVLDYGRYYHLLRHFKPDFERTLMIGGAGYTFPKEYLRRYPDAMMDVAEIDPKMTAIARKFFRLRDDPRLNIIHQDGRIFLNSAESGKYDVVLMDAFGSLFSVPYQLTTLETVQQISRVMKDDGVVIFNLGSSIKGEGSGFLQAEFKTYQAVFPRVYLFKVNADHTDERLQNLIIVACKSGNTAGLESTDPEIGVLLSHLYKDNFPLEKPVITDDLAPVEYYNSLAQNLYQSSR